MLADDEAPVKYSYGWVFVHMSNDTADEKLQEASEEVEQDITGLEGEMQDVRQDMDKLKNVLYSKFGNAINLEED